MSNGNQGYPHGKPQVSHSDKCGKEHLLTRTRILMENDTYLGGHVATAGVLEETLGIRDIPSVYVITMSITVITAITLTITTMKVVRVQ